LKVYLNIHQINKKIFSFVLFTGDSIGINFDKSELISNLGRIMVFAKHFVIKVIVRVKGK